MHIAAKPFLIICLLLGISLSNAYGNKEDSLKRAISQTKDNCEKIRLLGQLSDLYIKDKIFDKSINVASEALNIAKWERNNEEIINAYNRLAFLYYYNFNFSKALENYFFTLRYLKATHKFIETARIYKDISYTYNNIKMPLAAIDASEKCIQLLKKHPNDYILSECYFLLGESYRILKDNEMAIRYFRKKVEILQKIKMRDKLGLGLNSLGCAFWALNKYDSSIRYFNFYYALSWEINDSIGMKRALSNLGSVLYSKGAYKESIKFYQKALKYNQRIVTPHTYLEMVHSYCKLNELDKAAYYFKLAKKVKAEDLNKMVKACDSLAVTYGRNHNKDKAMAYMAFANELHKKIFEQSQATFESAAKTKYEVEGMEARILEKEANQLLKENLRLNVSQNRFLIVILCLIVIIGIFLVYIYRKKLKEKEQNLTVTAKEKSLLIKELSFLKNQFNSHITFNFLNFCYGNIFQISSQTGEAIALFSDILWYSLKTNIEEKISVKKEVEHIQNFLKLQQLLTTKLFVNFRHNHIPETKLIHPRILITFIENAFKHGKTTDENAPVEILLETDEHCIRLDVKNKKGNDRKSAGRDTGIGHENVDQLLNIFYKDKYNLHIEDSGELYSCSLVLKD